MAIIIWRCLIIVSVLHLVTMESINTVINGALSKLPRMRIRMNVEDIVGVVLYCIDSERNQFGLVVSRDSDYIDYIRINYNKIYKDVRLSEFCGCDPCEDRGMQFIITFTDGRIEVTCSHRVYVSVTLTIGHNNDSNGAISDNNNNNDYILYPIPVAIIGERNKIFITIGNIGPYIGDGGVAVAPLTQQMRACLRYFNYDNEIISLIGGGSNIQPSCPRRCIDNICNGGRCTDEYGYIICDCSSTALSGWYCNRTMKTYIRGGHNSYERHPGSSWPRKTYVKMTWRQSMRQRMYCLMEVIGRSDHVTIWTNKAQLMVNSTVIGLMNIYGINFVTVNTNNDNLTIKINNNESRMIIFTMGDDARINIGSVEGDNNRCVTFEGTYDFDSVWYLWRRVRIRPPITRKYIPTGTSQVTSSTHKPHLTMMIIIIGTMVGIVIIINILLCGIWNRRVNNIIDRTTIVPNAEMIELRGDDNDQITNTINSPYISMHYRGGDHCDMNSGDNRAGTSGIAETNVDQPPRIQGTDHNEASEPINNTTTTDYNDYSSLDRTRIYSIILEDISQNVSASDDYNNNEDAPVLPPR